MKVVNLTLVILISFILTLPNQRKVDPNRRKDGKIAKALKTPLRFATMPAGMLHDISQGGVIAMGKNFMPRLQNALHGNSFVSHADIQKRPVRDKNAKTEAKGGKNSQSRKHGYRRNGVYRRNDRERKPFIRQKGGKRRR